MAKNLYLTVNQNVVNQLRESTDVVVKVKNIPHENIEIVTPNYLSTIESMIESRPEIKNDPKEMQYLEFFMALPYKVSARKIDTDTWKISVVIVTAKKIERAMDFTVNTSDRPIYDMAYCIGAEEGEWIELAEATVQFIGKLLNYLDKPTTIKEVHNVKEPKTKKDKKKKAGKKKTPTQYVYKTVYKVSDISVEKSTRTRRNSAERQWNKEEWQRRGHYRVYRDKNTGEIKKRVWIDTTVCRAHGKIKENQNFKITRID